MEASVILILTAIAHYALQLAVLLRALIRPGREATSRLAWVLVILSVPALGVVLYLLLGEVSPGRRRAERMRAVRAGLPTEAPGIAQAEVPDRAEAAFGRAASVNGFAVLPGNRVSLSDDASGQLAALVEAIDAAERHVHIVVYIWLTDETGRALAEAVMRAAARGVTCRVMVDGLGSRALVRSDLWRAMTAAGVKTRIAFDTRWAAGRSLLGRVDIRNHRKIFVIDGALAFCGSRNCADPAFLPKAKYAPWHDVLMRLEGPVVWQVQALFAADWTGGGGDALSAELAVAPAAAPDGVPGLAFGTGPDLSPGAVADVVGLLLAAARQEVVISTPYFVPTAGLLEQLRATALRGVAVTLILPARNDSRMVAFASRATYPGLMQAGVRIVEHAPGLLHAKTLRVDEGLMMLGSANLDRRSFELNFENNILLADPVATADLAALQTRWIAASRVLTAGEVAGWSLPRRLAHNIAAMISPVL
ncbi:cardiolipin synthase [Pararhodobacter sp. CCB-MM2]|uniref:cardiolipin synthase n=1 Tax=Pararhodobacter sp. CCB-MM2 TaxID=1786003 RepID=UPI00082E6FAA|nr:cardiolipin synthase [Pararhodobacter sp. CCB-MM2]